MKNWIRRTLLGVFGGAIAFGALTACGHHRHHPGPGASQEEQARWRDQMVDRVAKRLELDAEQKQKLAALATKLHEQRMAIRGATDPRAEMQSLVAGAKFDRTRAQSFVNEKAAAVTARSPEVVAALGDFYDSLRPEQQAKVREFMQRGRGRWRHG
jgi:protein CpxP